jgi:hypothetical protein
MKKILFSIVASLSLGISMQGFSQPSPLGPFGQGQPTMYSGSRFPGGAIGRPPMSVGEQPSLMMAQNQNGAGAQTAGCTVGRNDGTRILQDGSPGGVIGAGHQ